ncbi:MAG: tilS [Sphingobacteriales bacterium]|nr:tilS [Sphingobacteriales bacterium]
MLPLKRFESFIKQYTLFDPADKVLLAVSAGRDSVLLAHLFHHSGYNFAIAHCNFMLRGAESTADEDFSKELAAGFDVKFHSTKFFTAEYGSNHHISIQMAARDLRYQWLEQIRKEFDYQYLAVAHHQNDTIETMLLNLTRGTGIAGLHGILPKRDKLIRPLLFLTRPEIDQLIVSENISYRDDASNESTKYARNKIRLEIIPKLKELNPNLEETFEANRRRFVDLEILLNDRVKELKTKLFNEEPSGEIYIDLAALQKLHPLNTLLFNLFCPYNFIEPVLHDLVRSWNGQSGKLFESATHYILLDRDKLILSKKIAFDSTETAIHQEDKEVVWYNKTYYNWTISASVLQLQRTATIAQLDAEKLVFPLNIRTWKAGDYFYPLGMGGKKKLSDFFTELKIPLNHKQNIGILVNGNGDILYVDCYRIDDRYKVTTETKKVYIFEQQTSYGK